MILLLAGALAWAQADPVLEITVWGRLAIDRAEDDIVNTLEEMGYSARRRGDDIVFRPPRGWMGAAIFSDGQLTFRRAVAGLQPLPTELYTTDPRRTTSLTSPNGQPMEPSVGAGPSLWFLPARRKLKPHQSAVLEAVHEPLVHYRAVVARTELEEQISALPDRLDALWSEGTPLSGSTILETYEERRAHVLDYWASRALTPQGDRVCRAVEAWLEAVVQHSDHPLTDAERSTYEARRPGRTLP
ncbi:MAG TPA: hypothetical protein ENK18_18525 [Deltaproteobacteria bacterium]|nr:hypothetical protein [Deltaproteobacteria bacterium]